ncbi:MAG: S-layer homology domain-containing protein, partial [Chloroflexi bacterium]|nr:S-layer homology domain-containing protein [Chloroflexota bacterium]
NIRGIVRNNIVKDVPYSGIGLYAAQNAQVVNNTIINAARVGHSPIYFGVTFQDWDPAAARPPSVNPIIRNNLISQSSSLPAECIFIRYSDELGGLSGLSGNPTMNNNLYFHSGAPCVFTDRRPGSLLEAGTFAQWQSHVNGEANSLTGDPLLAANASLSVGSPAIDSGNGASCPAVDQLGVARPQDGNGDGTAVCDIGALEYSTSLFGDVPSTHWAAEFIERLYNAGITGGCSLSPLMYCPNAAVTRAQMAIFILRGMHGSAYAPPPATGTIFTDVPASYWAAAWVEQFAAEGITGGCGGGNYCPDANITRAQMAIFLLRGEHGSAYVPPSATGTVFTDVPLGSFAADWIEQLADEGVTAGCGGGNYCPNANVTRAEMAVFLVRAFSLP